MNDNFENNFEDDFENNSEMTENTNTSQEDAWEEESEEKLYDELDEAFREDDSAKEEPNDGYDDLYSDPLKVAVNPNKGKGAPIIGAIVSVVLVAAVVLVAILFLRGYSKSDSQGSGNISNMAFMAVSGEYTYYIEPSTYALCRFKNNPADAELATKDPKNHPALFLTDIEGSLYYVSMTNGFFMRYVDGESDEIVIDNQCYYPTYKDGVLYYLSLADYLVYAIPVTDNVFGEATPITQSQVYYLNIYENTLYYIDALDQLLYAMPIDGSADPKQVSSSQMSYINIVDGYIYFMRYPDEANTVTPALCRISVNNYENEEVIVDNSYCIYNNYANGYIYYMNYTNVEDEAVAATMVHPLYRVKADGSKAPEQVSPDQSLYIHVINDYVYYLTLLENDVPVWKRLPVGTIDEDGTKAEVLPAQELLPLTDEPFALEDMLGEENTDATNNNEAE